MRSNVSRSRPAVTTCKSNASFGGTSIVGMSGYLSVGGASLGRRGPWMERAPDRVASRGWRWLAAVPCPPEHACVRELGRAYATLPRTRSARRQSEREPSSERGAMWRWRRVAPCAIGTRRMRVDAPPLAGGWGRVGPRVRSPPPLAVCSAPTGRSASSTRSPGAPQERATYSPSPAPPVVSPVT